ncbi:hypothetical protein [Streptomyces sp. NPDC058307]|uniref:hypothetical protein n=1 Tax=Streptomyces sp. NPDC058307 TaxID=3346439 RepID=UPI0036E58BD4
MQKMVIGIAKMAIALPITTPGMAIALSSPGSPFHTFPRRVFTQAAIPADAMSSPKTIDAAPPDAMPDTKAMMPTAVTMKIEAAMNLCRGSTVNVVVPSEFWAMGIHPTRQAHSSQIPRLSICVLQFLHCIVLPMFFSLRDSRSL